MLRLENPVRHYAWGSTTFIPGLIGREPDGRPWAELWMGAHASAPSIVCSNDERIALDVLIDRDPASILGLRTVRAHGARLPFLFKLLAADQPLSIQAHPDREQARAGFARENAAGIPLDAPHRNYRDDNHKPELLVALTPFVALQGFRSPASIAAEMSTPELAHILPELDHLHENDGLRRFFQGLMTMQEDRREAALRGLERAVAAREDARGQWARDLLMRYPGDVGAFAPLFLDLVELAPGEGLFLRARELHAYLRGAGLELMASSDNVLRGGLTPKHVDVPELLATLRFESSEPRVVRPRSTDTATGVYPTPTDEFRLVRIEPGDGHILPARETVAILLCTEGRLSARGRGLPSTRLHPGDAWLLPAGTPEVELNGAGLLWLAEVP